MTTAGSPEDAQAGSMMSATLYPFPHFPQTLRPRHLSTRTCSRRVRFRASGTRAMEPRRVEAWAAVRGKPSRTKVFRFGSEEGGLLLLLSRSLALTRSVTRESGTRSPRSTASAT